QLGKQFPDFRPTLIFDRGVGSLAAFEQALDLEYHLLCAVAENRKWAPYLRRTKTFTGGFYYKRTYYQHKVYHLRIGRHPVQLWVFYSPKKARQEAQDRERHAIGPARRALAKLRLNQYRLKTRAQVKAKVQVVLKHHHAQRWLRVTVVGSERQGTLQLTVTR